MAQELRTVVAAHGPGSPASAAAQSDLGHLLLNSNQPDRAVEYYRQAAAARVPDDPEGRKDHLTYRLNLGVALQLAGRLDEAEAELRDSAGERLAFYGRGHAGYAFGLEPLAEVLLARGDLPAARQVIEETVDNFWRNGHERVATALVLRAEIWQAGGGQGRLFPGLDRLPDEIVEQVAASVLNRRGTGDPATYRALLADLAATLEERLGPDHQSTLNALSMLANTGHDLGDQAGRVEAIQRVLASYDRQGRAAEATMAAQGLAMAYGDAGDHEQALRTYAAAWSRADQLGRPELASQVLRNWGLALAEVGHTGPAEQRLSEAVAQAGRATGSEILGRAQVALGIFLQHQQRLPEARAALEEGLSVLAPAHPDAIIGQSHLAAVAAGRTCGCGDLEGALVDAFRRFVLGRLPADLLADLDVTIEDGDFQIRVELRREPTEEEIERLNGAIQSAHAEFRQRPG